MVFLSDEEEPYLCVCVATCIYWIIYSFLFVVKYFLVIISSIIPGHAFSNYLRRVKKENKWLRIKLLYWNIDYDLLCDERFFLTPISIRARKIIRQQTSNWELSSSLPFSLFTQILNHLKFMKMILSKCGSFFQAVAVSSWKVGHVNRLLKPVFLWLLLCQFTAYGGP